MNIKRARACIMLVCVSAAFGDGIASGGEFYREHPALQDTQVSNSQRWLRVNDQDVSLDETFGNRPEAKANGLMLVPIDEDLFLLERAELRLDMWGGHPGTTNKRFLLNGKEVYEIPEVGTETGNCTYSYPVINLKVGHLVSGANAFQFTCDRGSSFWGHFIIDSAAVRCFLKPDHPDLLKTGLDKFKADVVLGNAGNVLNETITVSISCPEIFKKSIISVDYFGQFLGFDDTGSGAENDWHGFTHKGRWQNHIGSASEAPFTVEWDTSMIPSQPKPMAIRAVVHFRDGFHYVTKDLEGLTFPAGRDEIAMHRCSIMPAPFWSRASRRNKAQFDLPADISSLTRAKLMIKVWDGGEGNIKEPFKINGHPYSVTSGRAIHDVVFTIAEVNPDHLKPGNNEITLLSDTEHHGIEVLLPGPVIIARYK
ncbi:MAG: hypothetical protein JXN61_14510 [Sedimentisphaerales bacterium]|nr:hypothetical protein [Sedimentisphaerales bacterium]